MTREQNGGIEIDALMARFEGLSVDEGRKVYNTLSSAEQAALDERGLKRAWRSARAREGRERRYKATIDEFKQAIAERKRLGLKPNQAFQRALDKARKRQS